MLAVGLSRRPLMPGMIVYQAISDPRLVTEIRDMLTQPHGCARATSAERGGANKSEPANSLRPTRSFVDCFDTKGRRLWGDVNLCLSIRGHSFLTVGGGSRHRFRSS